MSGIRFEGGALDGLAFRDEQHKTLSAFLDAYAPCWTAEVAPAVFEVGADRATIVARERLEAVRAVMEVRHAGFSNLA